MILTIMDEQISIKVDNVSKLYGGTCAVNELSFRVKKGTIHGFLGPNGAGKSTTMRLIAGLLRPSHGKVYVNGKDVQSNLKQIKSCIGILLEIPPLYKDMEVVEYLTFVAKLHKVPKQLLSHRLESVMQKLGIQHVSNRLIGNLSKGFKQRVGVAQAIIHSPDIVILDEPTVGLDPSSVISMRELIRELKEEHTVLLSSHLLHEVGLICDEVTIIDQGQLVATGSMDEINNKLVGKNIIVCLVSNFQKQIISKLANWDAIQKIDHTAKDNLTEISIYTDSIEDRRGEISKFIVESGMELYEFYQHKRDLEQIFLEVTGSRQ